MRFSPDEWKQVIFSDERKFNLDGPNGCAFCWYDSERGTHFVRTSERGWFHHGLGAFSDHGVSELVVASGKQTANMYCKTLEDHLLPFFSVTHGENYIFQQDSVSIHRTRVTKERFKEKNVVVLDWPACSPDLNPIENLWAILARDVHKNGGQFSTRNDLACCVKECWSNIE